MVFFAFKSGRPRVSRRVLASGIAWLLLSAAARPAVPSIELEDSKSKPWSFAVGVSYMGTTGNTRTQRIGADFSFKRLPEPWGIDGALSYIRGFEKGETTMERSRAGVKGSRNIRDGWDCFLSGTGERDRFAGYDSRLSLAAGATLRTAVPSKNELQLDVGLSWNEDRPVVGPRDAYPGGYFQTGFTHNWTPSSKFQQRLLYAPNFAEGARWRGESETAVVAYILDPLAFKGSLLVRFNNEPPEGYKKVDTATVLSFVYSF